VKTDNIAATGYGMAKPVADNNTAKGRSLNRRVQLVVSGDAIGVGSTGSDAEASASQPATSTVTNGTSNPQ